jgi:high-affinity Fe2+/Pb2+ permease
MTLTPSVTLKTKLVLGYLALVGVGALLGTLLATFVYFFWTGTESGKNRMMMLAFLIPAACAAIYALGIWLQVRQAKKDQ